MLQWNSLYSRLTCLPCLADRFFRSRLQGQTIRKKSIEYRTILKKRFFYNNVFIQNLCKNKQPYANWALGDQAFLEASPTDVSVCGLFFIDCGLFISASSRSGTWPAERPLTTPARLIVPRLIPLVPVGIAFRTVTVCTYSDRGLRRTRRGLERINEVCFLQWGLGLRLIIRLICSNVD